MDAITTFTAMNENEKMEQGGDGRKQQEEEEEEDEDEDEESELQVEIKDEIKIETQDDVDHCHVTSSTNPQDKQPRISDRKVCGVCGHTAKNNHFGAICCDSCRAFFRRSVQSNTWDTFYCLNEGRCDVRRDRKCCQFCRFKRCQKIGMNKSLVLPEEDRKALMSRKLEKRRRIIQEHQLHGTATQHCGFISGSTISEPESRPQETEFHSPISTDGRKLKTSDVNDMLLIQTLQRLLRKTLLFQDVPMDGCENKIIEQAFFIFCKSIGKFFGLIPGFRELDINHRNLLLKPAVAKAIFIIGTYQYESERNCWPKWRLSPSCKFPVISMSAMGKFIDDDDTMFKWKAFIGRFSLFFSDEINMLLTLVIALFDFKNSDLVSPSALTRSKTKYMQLFEFYKKRQQNDITFSSSAGLLLEALTDIEELKNSFQKSTVKPKTKMIAKHSSLERCSRPYDSGRLLSIHTAEEAQDANVLINRSTLPPEASLLCVESHLLSEQRGSRYIKMEEDKHENLLTHSRESQLHQLPDHNYIEKIKSLQQQTCDSSRFRNRAEAHEAMEDQKAFSLKANHQWYYTPLEYQSMNQHTKMTEFESLNSCHHHIVHMQCPSTAIPPKEILMQPCRQHYQSCDIDSTHSILPSQDERNYGRVSEPQLYTSKKPRSLNLSSLDASHHQKNLEFVPSDVELLQAARNALPPHLALHLAKRIGAISKDHDM